MGIFDYAINAVDVSTIIFIIAFGEFIKKIFKSANIKYFSNFWQIVLFVTPFAVAYGYFMGIDKQKFVLSYFVSFWLYQAVVKEFLIFTGFKERIKNSNIIPGGANQDLRNDVFIK